MCSSSGHIIYIYIYKESERDNMNFSERENEKRLRARMEALAKKWTRNKEEGTVLARMSEFCQVSDSFGLSHEQAIGCMLQTVLPTSTSKAVQKKMSAKTPKVPQGAAQRVGSEDFVATMGIADVKFFTGPEDTRSEPGYLPVRCFERTLAPRSWGRQSLDPFAPSTTIEAVHEEMQSYNTPVTRRSRPVPGIAPMGPPPVPTDPLPAIRNLARLATPPGEQQFHALLSAIFGEYRQTRVLHSLRQSITQLRGKTTFVREQCEILLNQAELAAFLECEEEKYEARRPDLRRSYVSQLESASYDALVNALDKDDKFILLQRERTSDSGIKTYPELVRWLEDLESDRASSIGQTAPNLREPAASPGGGVVNSIGSGLPGPKGPADLQMAATLRVAQLLENEERARNRDRERERASV